MSRMTVIGDSQWEPERLETDAEWNARLLQEIIDNQDQTHQFLKSIDRNIECMRFFDEEKKSPAPVQIRQDPPTPAWQFIVSWIVIFIMFLMFISK